MQRYVRLRLRGQILLNLPSTCSALRTLRRTRRVLRLDDGEGAAGRRVAQPDGVVFPRRRRSRRRRVLHPVLLPVLDQKRPGHVVRRRSCSVAVLPSWILKALSGVEWTLEVRSGRAQLQLMTQLRLSGDYAKVTARAATALMDPIENDATLYKTTVFMSATSL